MGKRISLETRRRRGKRGGNDWVTVPLSGTVYIDHVNDDEEDARLLQQAKFQLFRKRWGKTRWVLLFVIIMFIIGIVVYNTV
jgi:hypothetical protein